MMAPFIGGVMIAAGWRSSGKTSIATGLAAALVRRGLAVQPFKKGPDFIDPQWLSAAAGRDCRNLDLHLQGGEGVSAYCSRHIGDAAIALVEGNLGLHDGMASDGSDSNAALARRLGLPVILVLDARGMQRGAAAIVMGLAAFDPQLRIAGVILNRLAGARHEAKVREAIESHTGCKVLGAVREDARYALVERHLGLIPANEAPDATARVNALAAMIESSVDIPAVIAAASSATMPAPLARSGPARTTTSGPRIGIARDCAFGFYYPDDLEALREAGATLVPFDATCDARLPAIDALVIGGGFPETRAAALEANVPLRAAIRAAIEEGLPVYAECGGLMYLARTLTYGGRTYRMVGAIPADTVMHAKPVGKGYVTLAPTADHPWCGAEVLHAHEFHYSSVENIGPDVRFAYRVIRGHGVDGVRDGLVYRNVLASYAHLRSVGGNGWARRFVAHARRNAHAVRRVREVVPEPRGIAA